MNVFLRSIVAVSVLVFSTQLYAHFDKTPTEKCAKTEITDQLLTKNRAFTEVYKFEFRGREFIGYPDVFSPVIFPSSPAVKEIPVPKGAAFLEIGPGTGIFSVQAALSGAGRVVAIDINPNAVANTQANAALHGVGDKVTAMVGDLFSPLGKDEKFDVIFWSIPFCHRPDPDKKMGNLELSVFDPEHEFLQRYLEGAGYHLADGGKVILTYSCTHGDLDFMLHFAEAYSWNVREIQEDHNDFISVELYEFTPQPSIH